MPRALDPAAYRDIVRRALDEDVAGGDVTTNATIPESARGRGIFLAKSDCVLAGLDVAFETFRQVDARLLPARSHEDGDRCSSGSVLAAITGPARGLLVGERTALNFLQRLSGIATMSRRFVDAAAGRITVLDTRKTTPTLRALEKYAVVAGGAANHRMGLFDAVLIKDNHVRLAGLAAAVAAARRAHAGPIEVEAQTLDEVDNAIAAGADVILADNMTTDLIRETVRRVHGRAKIEISGGVTLDRIPELAETGADSVSVGALTHSAPAIDISFEIEIYE
ncbi:MAG TPA: carboxylating nicotinate-nucleotide diphosphorylase [Vicinamibacterales bacterium]|nr:carboxylating nicotinate-nucleotide diphosphorylase [Vicinamibacterales bacterium]